MTKIRILPRNLINQIAAGEVVERPASVVKELIENSIDAGAEKIEIVVKDGGKTYISVLDDGSGMDKEELELSIQRHATSKLATDDLLHISSFGFRGEALPSIASVSRVSIITNDGNDGWKLEVNAGEVSGVKPAGGSKGTKIEVRDLFYAIPARLKFMKSDRGELSGVIDMVQRLALSHPEISFYLNDNTKYIKHDLSGKEKDSILLSRIADILGKDFKDNSVKVDVKKGDVYLYGYIGKPTYTKANSLSQFLFVNGRPVKDKLLISAVRVAYQDVMERGKYPAVVLFLDLPMDKVDVNVHPAKAEVRFREAGFIRGFVVSVLRNVIAFAGVSPSVVSIDQIIKKKGIFSSFDGNTATKDFVSDNISFQSPFDGDDQNYSFISNFVPAGRNLYEGRTGFRDGDNFPLGIARGQIHNTYILSQTRDGMVIVDQHACHERIVYEKLRKDLTDGNISRQLLLIPEVVELNEKGVLSLLDHKKELVKFGLEMDAFGKKAVVVRETPAILGEMDIQGLVKDLSESIEEIDNVSQVEDKLFYVVKTYACHTSVRAGQALSLDEMNALLREVEATENSGQCNHGRPSYVKLELKDIEKLFKR